MTSSASISAPSSGSTTICVVFAPRWTSCASSREKATVRLLAILADLVRRAGLREAYVAMDCLRGRPPAGAPYHPAYSRNYLLCFAMPWVWVFYARAARARGARGHRRHAPNTARIGRSDGEEFSLGRSDARKFRGARSRRGNRDPARPCREFVTEGPGFNVFTVIDGIVASPPRGALEGITRLSVFELCEALGIPTQTRTISRAEIEGADEIFFSTTAGGIMPVSRLGFAYSGQ